MNIPTFQDFRRIRQGTIPEPKDPRWIDWAQAVCNGTTLARRKWTGEGRPFRQDEYEARIAAMLEKKILRKTSNAGYRPNRAGGWEYIKAMAEGSKNPPPPLTTSAPTKSYRHFHHARNVPPPESEAE